jgi:predicted nucleic acid-binding protein
LVAAVPRLLFLELLNVAGRRWQWPEAALLELGRSLADLGLEVREPGLDSVARWVARGLTAYDAAYVALAEAGGVQLVTDDDLILQVAAGVATPLAG